MKAESEVKPVKRRDRVAQLERDLAIERERAKMLREDLRQALGDLSAAHAAMDITGTRPPGLGDLSGKPVRPLAINELDLGDYFRQVEHNYRSYANPFHHYEQLLTMLESHPRVAMSPCYEFAGAGGGGSIHVALRHDIDADPVTAVRMARVLARRGIGATFYLLHTAIYYGQFFGSIFIRHRELPRWIEEMLVGGCELGVHNDALGAHQRLGVDGPAALVQEIEWLRGQGATIRGTAGHNSAPVYQAENSEVFRGRVLWNTDDAVRGRLPLGVLDEQSLGLTYEGTFAARRRAPGNAGAFAGDRASADIRSPGWMRTYLCDNPCCQWEVDMQVWVVGQNRWVAGGRVGGQVYFRDGLTLADLRSVIEDLPGGSRCLFVLHPEYFRA
ncbi:MAG: hypothetical protein DYG94_14370 [Leptolyngbya sp. PLA3]|nr:MAG: hypothetical protein EDM82_13380 [Cyanobacteria bacterium CYA]MCE7969913.1 hypothetical protein [Leptolyngbya sp. PL-A3]